MMAMAGILQVQAALPGAEGITQVAIRDIRPRRRRALPFDVMVVTLLCEAHFHLEAKYLLAVLTKLAVHVVFTGEDLFHAFGESI